MSGTDDPREAVLLAHFRACDEKGRNAFVYLAEVWKSLAADERTSVAKLALFDYIEVFYDQRRRHSTLGQISPARFEREAAGVGHGRCHPRGRQERAHRDLENRTERGFPRASTPIIFGV